MLTDAQLRKAQKADKPYKLSDTGGLYLYVTVECKRLPPRSFRARRSPAAFLRTANTSGPWHGNPFCTWMCRHAQPQKLPPINSETSAMPAD